MFHQFAIRKDVFFSSFTTERHISLPAENLKYLRDVQLAIHGLLTIEPSQARIPRAPDDIRIVINNHDFTQSILEYITSLFLDNEIANRNKYFDRMNLMLSLAERTGLSHDLDLFRHEIERIMNMPTSSFFSKLGDTQLSRFDILHVFNHLYTGIDIPMMSLKRVLETDNAHDIGIRDLRSIIVSSGGYASTGSGVHRQYGGVCVEMDLIYDNPLEPLLRRTLAELRQARLTLERQRNDYLHPTITESRQLNSNLESRSAAIIDKLAEVDDSVGQL